MADLELAVVILAIVCGVLSLGVCCACCVCTRHDSADKHCLTGELRRKLMKANLPPVRDDVVETKQFIINRRGMALYTHTFEPLGKPPKAVICFCHGFADNTTWCASYTAQRLCADAQVAVAVIDYEGHGQSDGLSVFVPDFDQLVGDVCDHFRTVHEKYPGLKMFLYGESMGGAVALKVTEAMPGFFSGALLLAPMCKIADEMKPPEFVVNALIRLSRHFPTAALSPVPDVLDKAFRDKAKLAWARSNPIGTNIKPRLATARECLAVSTYLEGRLSEVSIPFLLLHGGADTVTDPTVSKELFERARSTDKTFKLYPGGWHALTVGELPETIEKVFADMVEWVDARCGAGDSAGAGAGAGATADAAPAPESASRAAGAVLVSLDEDA